MRFARRDPGVSARVVSRKPLRYEAEIAGEVGAGWVRAGSALARFGKRLMMVQDDALWLSWWDEQGRLRAEPLPALDDTRLFDDKRKKPDFEAAAVIGEALFVFGSGSLPSRERIAIVDAAGARLCSAAELYHALRGAPRFAGPQLNVEGALVDGDALVLYSRGNAASIADGDGFDGSVRLRIDELVRYCAAPETTACPRLGAIEQYRLGDVGGVRLTLTDVASQAGCVYYVAAAEASPDAVADGEVLATAFGRLETEHEPRYTLIEDEDGQLLRDKVEGLAPGSAPGTWLGITDPDDARRPAELLELATTGW